MEGYKTIECNKEQTLDVDIIHYRYRRILRIRKDRLDNVDALKLALKYLENKLKQRFFNVMASDAHIQFWEQDRDNVVKNLVTMIIWFDLLETLQPK